MFQNRTNSLTSSINRILKLEILESRMVPAVAPVSSQVYIGFQPQLEVSNVLSFNWGNEFYGTKKDSTNFDGSYNFQYGKLVSTTGGADVPFDDITALYSKAPENTTWSVYQNGVKTPVNIKYYAGDKTTDQFVTDIPAHDFQVGLVFVGGSFSYVAPSPKAVILPLNLLSNGSEIRIEFSDLSGTASVTKYTIFQGDKTQTGSIAVLDADYAEPTNGAEILRAHDGEQAAALLLEPNQVYKFRLAELGNRQATTDTRDPLISNLVVSLNRSDSQVDLMLENASIPPNGNNEWLLTIFTGGKSGMVGLRITNTNLETAFTSRYLGIIIKDANGLAPSRPDHLAIGTVNQSTSANQKFFQGTLAGDPSPGTVKAFDSQYIYINGGPTLVPRQPADSQTGFLPKYTSIDAPVENPPNVNNPSSWRTSGGGYDGKKLIQSLREAIKVGSTPTVVLYNFMAGVLDSGENVNEGPGLALANLKNKDYMLEYFKDFKFVMDTIRGYAHGSTVNFIIEPDFLSYMFVNNKLDPGTPLLNYNILDVAIDAGMLQPGTQLATASGNTLRDFVMAINGSVRNLSSGTDGAVNLRFGWKLNLWAADTGGQGGISKVTDRLGFAAGQSYIQTKAAMVADWFGRAGILAMPVIATPNIPGTPLKPTDFLALDKYGIDGGNPNVLTKPGYTDPQSTDWFFNSDHWDNYLLLIGTIRKDLLKSHPEVKDLPIRLWQIPVGRVNTVVNQPGEPDFPALPNTTVTPGGEPAQGAFEDSAVSYFFGETFTGQTPTASPDENEKRLAFFNPNGFGNQARDPGVYQSGDNIVWEKNLGLKKAAGWGVESIDFGAGLPDATSGGGYANIPPTDHFYFAYKTSEYLKNPVPLGKAPSPPAAQLLPDYGSPSSNLVASYFRSTLGREPGAGLTSFSQALEKGSLTRHQLAQTILHSTEYHSRTIAKYYLDFLGRAADTAGLEGWVQATDKGLPLDDVISGILTSPEFSGIRDNTLFVKTVFQELLDRQPTPDGLAHAVAILNSGLPRKIFVTAILNSAEASDNLVDGVYNHLFNRTPSDLEKNAWVNQLVQPDQYLNQFLDGIFSSEETATKLPLSTGGTQLALAEVNALNLLGLTYLQGKPTTGDLIPGANLRYGNLSDLDLSALDLTGANLGFTDMYNTNLAGTILKGADLDGVISRGIVGIPASLPDGWILGNGYLIGRRAILLQANLNGLNLAGINLKGAFLSEANLINTNLSQADLTNIDLDQADLAGAILDGVISSGITGTPKALPTGWSLVNGSLIKAP